MHKGLGQLGFGGPVSIRCSRTGLNSISRDKLVRLAGERIDIVRWNDSLQVLIPNALQPAEVEDVILCPMLGRVIVLVREDQLSLAIGKKGQNVRLASRLSGWKIDIKSEQDKKREVEAEMERIARDSREVERKKPGQPGARM